MSENTVAANPDRLENVVDLTDIFDDTELADVLDDSPERIHSDPLPSRPSFPSGTSRKNETPPSPSALIDTKDHQQLSPSLAGHDATKGPPSNRTSTSDRDREPGFAFISGEINGTGYNETTVDIITVPCPGADPIETWKRDPLPDDFFGNPLDTHELITHPTLKELAGDTILSPGMGSHYIRTAHLWVRQGIRRFASTARVLLYRHRELVEGSNLEELARDLLETVLLLREASGEQTSRPLFFIAHSVGGLVVKKALVMASSDERYRHAILYNCHGISFFAVPHRGSSYMSMYNLSDSIKALLHLQRPLPRSLSSGLRLGNKDLLKMHEAFIDITSEMRIWTFYETIDSLLSGSGMGITNEVQFSAPLVSIKSALVNVRQETIYSSLESDHAHCASFGLTNPRTLNTYLEDLAGAILKAQNLSQTRHNPLHLKEQVKIELIGFYEDPDADGGLESDMRLYFTKYHLAEFLSKGPEVCLEERLRRVSRRASPVGGKQQKTQAEDGLLEKARRFVTRLGSRSQDQQRPDSPDIVLTQPPAPPEEEGSLPPPLSKRLHSLTIPLHSSGSRPSSRGTSSTVSDPTDFERSQKDGLTVAHHIEDHRTKSDPEQVGLGISGAARKSRAERLSKTAALQDLTAGFSRPDPDQRRFMWMHLPFTNPLWVKDIFDKLSETHQHNFTKLFNHENWVSKHVQGRHSRTQPSFVKPAFNYLPAESAPSPRHSPSATNRPPTSINTPAYLSLYLPYLHFDTYRHIIRRRHIITTRLTHGRARPVPREVASLESLELRAIWEYLGHDPPLNCRRTLDQFGYPSLRDTYARDDDQMLYKLTKQDGEVRAGGVLAGGGDTERVNALVKRYSSHTRELHAMIEREKDRWVGEEEGEEDLRDGNLLMVDQLWLWAIDTTTLTTFFPKRESRPSEGALFQQADLRNSIYNELNGDLTGRCENALDLAAFVALHAVTVLLDRSSHPELEVFRIFEEAIGMLTERMTSNLKKFRMQTFHLPFSDSDSDPEDNTASSIKKRHRRETERAERENRENTSALLELRDMEDELKTLQRLFDTQTTMISKMLEIYTSDALKEVTRFGQGYLQEALDRLGEYKLQVAEMLERVAATRGDYEKMLEMAQRQAQVDDVRWSRLQTELASSQNLSVLIFTIFTVLFLPLSFFTSLFGMNTAEWGGDGGSYPSIAYIGKISLPLSAIVILATLVAALSSHVQVFFQKIGRGLAVVWAWMPDTGRGRWRAERERERNGERERRRRDREYDFWATVRKQRTWAQQQGANGYEIPGSNRTEEQEQAGSKRVRTGTGFDSGGTVGGRAWRRRARPAAK